MRIDFTPVSSKEKESVSFFISPETENIQKGFDVEGVLINLFFLPQLRAFRSFKISTSYDGSTDSTVVVVQ